MTSPRVRSAFDRSSTAEQVAAGLDLTGRRVVITGGASGLGTETARVLAGVGAEVTIAVRNVAAGQQIADRLGRGVRVAALELTDLASVRAFAAAWDGPLHVLVNNAGIMAAPEMRTAQGWEMQLATNHLGHHALANLLQPALAAAGSARVVSVSSRGHRLSDVHLDDLNFERRDYDAWQAYGQSKTANILFAVEADRRWREAGIRVNALHPGRIMTNLVRYLNDDLLKAIAPKRGTEDSDPVKTVEEGAATQVFLAASPLVDGVGGRYFEDCNEAAEGAPDGRNGYAAYAMDQDHARELWEISDRLVARA